MSNPNPVRIAAGTPDGGRFAPSGRTEADIDLPPAGGLTPVQRTALEAQRATLRKEADQAQARVDAVEMQLLADDLVAAHPGYTHVHVNRQYRGAAQVELYNVHGGVLVVGSARPGRPVPPDDDLAGRLGLLAERNGFIFHKMLLDSQAAGNGVPIADLASADKARMAQESDRSYHLERANEQQVGDVVRQCVPDAVSWRVGTEEFDNGYFYTPSELWAKKADGTEELVDSWEMPGPAGEEARQDLEDALAEMGDRDGPLGERTSHEADIQQEGATR